MKKLRATLLLMLVHASLTDASEYLDSPVYRTIEHDGATRSFTLHAQRASRHGYARLYRVGKRNYGLLRL